MKIVALLYQVGGIIVSGSWMDCVFPQCCEQVPSGAQLRKGGVCLSPAGERSRRVFMLLGRLLGAWLFL